MMRWRLGLIIAPMLGLTGCISSVPPRDVSDWIATRAVPVSSLGTADRHARDLERAFAQSRVIALGEATHGQRESFEAKLAITKHLIETPGFRIVAYEASASRAVACDMYISGASDNLNDAMGGFGMMIWNVEENAALLRHLRAHNQTVPPHQRVRFVGIDVQDAQACAKRLVPLLATRWPDEAKVVQSISERLDGTVQQMFSGDRAAYDDIVREQMELAERMRQALAQQPLLDDATQLELRSALREFEGTVHMFLTGDRRDQAMADMMLGVLADSGPHAKAVVWAHNLHITKSPLHGAPVKAFAAGGHLARALGDEYYAIGFAFGEGDFVANDLDGTQWIYRTYRIDAPPAGSLESWFAQHVTVPSLIDLRRDTQSSAVEQWKVEAHGQRWYGGYKIPADYRETARDASKLMPTTPGEAYDALLFLPRTTGTTPWKN